jgi:hypothetical protein
VLSREFIRENTTTDSFSEAVGARPGRVRADMNRVEKMVAKVRRRHSQSVLRKQDRSWREMQKRKVTPRDANGGVATDAAHVVDSAGRVEGSGLPSAQLRPGLEQQFSGR